MGAEVKRAGHADADVAVGEAWIGAHPVLEEPAWGTAGDVSW